MSVGAQGAGNVSRILTYHEILPCEPRYLYSVSVAQFEEDVRRVAKMSSPDVRTGAAVRITFDDGHASQFKCALPVLEAYSMKGIFFVTAGWAGARSGYMSWAQLRDLSSLGHEVQSHGWSHALLTQCSDRQLEIELARSKDELESHLGICVDAISVPGGRWNSRILDRCARVGYQRVFVSDPWLLTKEVGRMTLSGRWMVTRHMSAGKIEELLEGRGFGMQTLRAKHFLKKSAKTLLGDNAYQTLWRILSRKRESLEDMEEKTH